MTVYYYYFARVPEETLGWENNPERIIGPLDKQAFAKAKTKLGLPDFTVKPQSSIPTQSGRFEQDH